MVRPITKLTKSKLFLAFMSIPVLHGCVSFSNDSGFSEVVSTVQNRSDQTPVLHSFKESQAHTQEKIQSLLTTPLMAEDAVRIALINSPALQAALTELGIAEADLVQAGKAPNPALSYVRLSRLDDEFNIERLVLLDVMGLLTIPMKTAIERHRFNQAKLQAAIDILQLVADTRKAYYIAVAAQQSVDSLEQMKEAAQASAELSRRMVEVGNFNKLQYAREQVFYAEVMAKLAAAKLTALKEREHLIRLLGLWGKEIEFKLPKELAELPKEPKELSQLECQALINRLDVQAKKMEIEAKAKALGLTKGTRFINVFELGYAHNTGQDIPRQRGYEISLNVPIFDWGDARIAKSQASYMQSVWQLRDIAINARSEVREAYQTYRATYDMTKHYRDEIVPLRKFILDQNMLRYNGMLVSSFELLSDAREHIASTNAYIENLRDFWINETDLQTALMVKSPHD
ncbi:TolC family protein [Candidatus Berkiella aquae]|uniref:Outer membrane efflux protein n=1 Tax=Candidatus Berkiella aquae TaxID=295108 RepID=A0A0Q9YKD8_9GAMM|nr:TolC family protein [Candidatus Berkiella aquae]MCS5712793.1 TolC family protein [Candidatus Berkiella aquae]